MSNEQMYLAVVALFNLAIFTWFNSRFTSLENRIDTRTTALENRMTRLENSLGTKLDMLIDRSMSWS